MRIDWRWVSLEDARRLTAGGAAHDCPRPVPGHPWIIHRLRGAAGGGLILSDRRGRLVAPLVLGSGEFGPAAASGDGAFFAWREGAEGPWQIRLARLPRGEISEALEVDGISFKDPVVHPDHERLLYASDEGSPGTFHLWEAFPTKGERRPLTSGARADDQPALSPSGRLVVFRGRSEQGADLYLLDTASLETRRLTAAPAESGEPVFVDVLRCREKWLTGVAEGAATPWPVMGRRGRIRVLYSQPDASLPYDVPDGTDLFRAELVGAREDGPDAP